ncbi:MAG: inositol monophosphatase family protein [Actinomycetota bacterium]
MVGIATAGIKTCSTGGAVTFSQMLSHDLERIAAALAVADDVLDAYTPGKIESTLKAGGDPLTEADTAVDDAVKQALLGPDEGWLSEETADSDQRLGHTRVWIVDPIDGTREFIEGIPEWCVSIGLAVNGEAVAGGILNPATGERVLGSVEAGVTYEGSRPQAKAETLSDAEILASRSEVKRGEWEWARELGPHVVPMGSVAYKLALVAADRADAAWTLVPKREWDIAAGAALLASAGVHHRRKDHESFRLNAPNTLLPGFVAANHRISDEVEALLQRYT